MIRPPIHSSCRHGPKHSFVNTNRQARWKQHWKRGERQRGDSNPCGQSPMDFESISLTTRTYCLEEAIKYLFNVCWGSRGWKQRRPLGNVNKFNARGGFGFDFTAKIPPPGLEPGSLGREPSILTSQAIADSDDAIGQSAGLPSGGWLGLHLPPVPCSSSGV